MMTRKIRHYFLRRKALRLFADRFLFEPLPPVPTAPVAPAPAPQTTFAPDPTVGSAVPEPTNTAPVMPAPPNPPASQPVAAPAPTSTPAPVAQSTPQAQIVETLRPMVDTDHDKKLDVINRRLTR